LQSTPNEPDGLFQIQNRVAPVSVPATSTTRLELHGSRLVRHPDGGAHAGAW
jgi:hypothetical protein